MINKLLFSIDRLSMAVGHAFAWSIIILTLGTCYEVFVRYVLNDPTSWAYDMSYLLYGALFLMSGAYALSRNAHVRGDVFYRLWPVRWQAGVELVLYFLFFFPGVTALVYAGYEYAGESYFVGEVSVNSPVGVPIWQLKGLIPIAGVFLWLQGVAQVIRCVMALRSGVWPKQLHDVEELETAILQQAERGGEETAK